MKSNWLGHFGIAAILLLAAIPAWAHHGNSDYDSKNVMTVHATVTQFLFVNPHCLIFFDIKNADGKMENWAGEMPPPGLLARRSGWTKDTVKPGDEITVIGSPTKNGSHNMQIKKIVLADGTEMPGTMII